MILAAGRGERMRPLTDVTPKPLLPVGGHPLIVWLLRALAAAGFERVVINVAHLGEQIEAELGSGAAYGVEICWSRELPALETAGGIARALPWFDGSPFVVVNGDLWTDYDFAALRRRGLPPGRLAHLVLVDNPQHHPQGDFGLEPDASPLSGSGSVSDQAQPRLTFSGIGCYHPDLFAAVASRQPVPLAPLLRTAMRAGAVSGEHFRGRWYDIGTPQRLLELDAHLRALGVGNGY